MTKPIESVYDMRWLFGHVSDFGVHGYCTVRHSPNDSARYDVYCQIDGDEVRIAREVTEIDAVMFVNRANAEQNANA